jgi:hypothetical protein
VALQLSPTTKDKAAGHVMTADDISVTWTVVSQLIVWPDGSALENVTVDAPRL